MDAAVMRLLLPLCEQPAGESLAVEKSIVAAAPAGIGPHERRQPQVAADPAIFILDDVARGAVPNDLAVPEEQDTVRVHQCKVHVMRYEVDRVQARDRQDLR